jgi:predicted permease
MLQDIRYALRTLRRNTLVAFAAVMTVGLGVGGATAVFTVVDAVLLRPLPYPEPDRLVRIWALTREGGRFSFSEPDFLDLAATTRTLDAVAAFRETGGTAVLSDGAEPERIVAVPVSASIGDVIGVRPAIGRMFTAAEDRAGAAERPVVLSHGLWTRRFGRDAQIVGRTVTLDGLPATVTGVMPEAFDFPGGADAWVPLRANPRRGRGSDLSVIGRLGPGTTVRQLGGELRELIRRSGESQPAARAGWSAEALPFSEWIVAPRFRDAVWMLSAAVGVLLLLACANVASLLVAQGATREGEMRIRAALGAGRGRLVRQLLTESALLAALGTAAAVLIAAWSVTAVRALGGDRVPRLEEVHVSGSVLAFACLMGIVSCLAFGLAPALHSASTDLRSTMDAGVRYSAGNRRVRHALVVVEVTLALILLIGAGLLGGSFVRLVNVDPGFDTSDTIAMRVELPSWRYADDRVPGFYRELLDRVRAMPGIASAGATSTDPFVQFGFSNDVTPAERAAEAPPSGLVQAGWRSVTPGYFEAMGVPLLAGRGFEPSDTEGGDRVVVVSESLARRLWPGASAIGRRIYWGGTTGRTRMVVGVAGDIRDVRLEAEPPPMLFVPHAQVPLPSMTIVMKTTVGAATMASPLRDAVRQLDPSLPGPPVHEISASRAGAAADTRFNLSLIAAFAAVALTLAATGVYAMLAFTVWERRREIAVRLALGASRPQIAGFVLRTGLGLTLAGVAIGTLAALGATRMLSSLLYGVQPTDPLTFAAAGAGLVATAALASWLPARQASRLDPASLLRE